MSILIKGIDLPKDRDCVNLSIYQNGDVYEQMDNGFYIIINAEAIQIDRPHGRLIDGDKLKDTLKEYCVDDDDKATEWYNTMGIDEAIDNNAPTILEAEE